MLLHKKQSIGLDIADRSIAVAVLAQTEDGLAVISRGYTTLLLGVVERGKIQDEKKLSEALREVFANASINPFETQSPVVFGLPASQVYFHILDLPMHKPDERENLVRAAALNSIPLPASDLLYSYRVISEDNQSATILLVAASRAIVSSWRKFFATVGLNVHENFDIESLAVRRGLFLEPPSAPVCIVDIGAVTSDIDIFDAKGLRYTYSVLIAGDTFTHEIAKINKISWEEAEDLKIRVGLTKDNNNILPTLVKTLEPLRDEVKTALSYFKDKAGERVSEVILVGGTSQLKGLVDYFSANLELPMRLGVPAANFVGLSKTKARTKSAKRSSKSPAENENNFLFIEAVGLARRAFSGWWQDSDPSIILTPLEDLTAAGNVLEKVERTVKKEEMIIQRAIKRIISSSMLYMGVLIVFLMIATAIFLRWLYKQESSLSFDTKATLTRPVNRNISSLVFPENPLGNAAPNQASETANKPAPTPETPPVNPVPEQKTEVQNQDQPPAPPAEQNPQVLITDTPTGWLNVRSGSGTNYPILTKVYPGKSYPLLQEAEKWYKIKVNNETEGWVASQYTAKQ